ncbi:MAG TPA: SpoIIE family protein phosphatase [Firmicutes bacterium]|nr:SpoIIE family protein phosphatase [Candidatus Fermentithermobacillaceae bacterium]
MTFKIDVGKALIPKKDEELPGDTVEIDRTGNSTVVVLADGLGSGVKANILSSITAKMTVGMLKYGCDLAEVIESLANTLPVCEVRHIAYSTFTVLQVLPDGTAYLAEYDNPPAIIGKEREILDIPRRTRTISGRVIREADFRLEEGSWVVLVSDGVIHAGIGGIWNLGWSHERVKNYIARVIPSFQDAQDMCDDICHVCNRLYAGEVGDDVSVATVLVRKPRYLTLLIGLPKDKSKDREMLEVFLSRPGKRAVAGGSTSQMVARELGKELRVNLGSMKNGIPPTGYIEGIDLVTEGTLTIARTLQYLRENRKKVSLLYQPDGASRLCAALLEADDILMLLGTAVNPAHQSPDLPEALQLKSRMVEELSAVLREKGKTVSVVKF